MVNGKKNGKIELLRLFFCLSVVLYHAGGDLMSEDAALSPTFSLSAHGRSGVEFFFLLSGYFAARTAYRMKGSKTSIGIDTYEFMLKKIKRVFPIHIIACVIMIIPLAMYSSSPLAFWNYLGNSIPSWFFLQRTGIYTLDMISIEWYICSMLFGLVIVFPLLRKWFDFTAYVLAPVASSMLIGTLLHKYGAMPGFRTWDTFIYACNLRGLAVVLLGVFVFVVSEKIRAKELKKGSRITLIILEDAAWCFAIFFVFSNMYSSYEGYFVYFTALALALSFARDYNSKFYDSKFVSYLGRITLPVYLCQNFARDIICNNRQGISDIVACFLVLLLVIGVGALVDFGYMSFRKHRAKNNS